LEWKFLKKEKPTKNIFKRFFPVYLNHIILNPSPTKPHENPNRLTLQKKSRRRPPRLHPFFRAVRPGAFCSNPKNHFFRKRARELWREAEAGEMAQFGDGGGDERRGWDPLRSDSAPPTMEGSAAAAVAAEGMFGGGGGPGGGSFFSGMDGLGARLDEVSRLRGAVAQVKGVIGLELIEVFGFFAL
jgi:hypothetical protein